MPKSYRHNYTGQETSYPPTDINNWTEVNRESGILGNTPDYDPFHVFKSDRFSKVGFKTKMYVLAFLVTIIVIGMILQTMHERSVAQDDRNAAAAHSNACAEFWNGRVKFAAQGNKMAPVQSVEMRQCPQTQPKLLGAVN